MCGNIPEARAGFSRGYNSSPGANEGPNPEQGKGPTSSTSAMNPSGGAIGWRVVGRPDPNEYLLERILSWPNLSQAWKRVKADRGVPGMDNMPIDDFMAYARDYCGKNRSSIFAGIYKPLPIKRVEIPKATAGTRPLGIPTVLDRLIQQAIAQVLFPIFDPGFWEASFGFRMGLSAHDAVYQVRDFFRKGYRVAVDADLAKFFDTVEHDVLMCRVSKKVCDKRVLKQIGKYLRAGVMINGRHEESRRGFPQGGPLLPMRSNILLDDLDKELEGHNHRFARYADDFVILVKSRRAGERVMRSITRFLEHRLKLKVNQEKSKVARTNEITFLGFALSGAKIRWSDKAFAKLKRRLKELTGRSWGVSMEFRFAKLTRYLRGWMGCFGISDHYAPIPEIDNWLRRRMRMCYWKQWCYCRTKVSELTKLGTFLRSAISVGMSRKGLWRFSYTLLTQSGMTNQWLKCQGLLSVKYLWVNIHYPATAR